MLEGQESEGETLVNHVLDMSTQTLQDQVKLLGSVSNYHWWASLDSSGNLKSSTNQPKYLQHLLFHPGNRKNLPASPRNLLMYLLPHVRSEQMPGIDIATDFQRKLVFNIMALVKYDLELEVEILHSKHKGPAPPTSPPPTNVDEVMGPPLKRRRYAYREVSAAPEVLLEDSDLASGGGRCAVTSSVPQRNMFTSFSEALHSIHGKVLWRKHWQDEHVVVLNDYCPHSGQLKPLDFVHVTATDTDSDEVQVKCTCRIYQYMHGRALHKEHLEEGVDTVLASNFTCMHCRFYSKFLQQIQPLVGRSQECVNKLHEKVKQSEIELNAPVVLLGEANPATTTKLSVIGVDSLSVVHIHFTNTGCFATCQDGRCQTLHKPRKRVPTGISLRDLDKGQMCEHLHTLFHNQDVLEGLFPAYFNSEDPNPGAGAEESDIADVPEPEVVNQDDIWIRNKTSDNISFNVNEGTWQCHAHSHYQPLLDRHDPDLVSNTKTRHLYCNGAVNHRGHYLGPSLSPDMSVEEGEPDRTCVACGAQFTSVDERPVLVYARSVSVIGYLSG